jgi:hypothetical protein
MNRLDDVVGPDKWELSYDVSEKGVVCTLSLEVPGGASPGSFYKVAKSGGGGFADSPGMSEENAFKSAFSSAIKLAACAFGIGRDLYQEGMPAYCADLHGGWASGTPQFDATPRQADPPATEPQPAPARNTQPTPAPAATTSNSKKDTPRYGWGPPFGKTGGAIFSWAKTMSDSFGVDVVKKMDNFAKSSSQSYKMSEWTQEFADKAMRHAVDYIKGLSNYEGEFESAAAPPAATAQPQPLAESSPSVKRALISAIVALLTAKFGREPSDGEIKSTIGDVAASAANEKGYRGEVLESLKECKDGVWVSNMLAAAKRQLEEHAKTLAQNPDDIPF